MKINFNKNWTFRKENGPEIKIDLPYDAMIQEMRTPECVSGTNSGFFPGGKYHYQKCFDLTREDTNKKIYLHFESVYQNCTVNLNGRKLKEHFYGYSCFDVDLSEAVKEGENSLTVDVDNSLEPNCRWYSGSGIYRDVTMYIVDKDHINLCHVETLSINPAVIEIKADTVNHSKLKAEIWEKDKLVYSGPTGKITVEDAHLWDEHDPYLYKIHIFNDKDEIWFDYGIRKLEWSSEKGLLVNGQSVLLRGGCIHHDHGILGANEYYDAEYRRISIMKQNGFNAIRMAHNPASQITLDVCDKLGMYVMNEAYDGWYIPKTYHDHSRHFWQDWQDDLNALVQSSYNHPSVIMYSIGNEITEPVQKEGVEQGGKMTEYIHSLDSSRPVTAGINVLLNVYAKMGFGVYKEKGEYKAEPLTVNKAYKQKKTGSDFFNAMTQKLGKLMFFMSKGKKGEQVCCEAAKMVDVLGLNYASSRYDQDVIKYPERMMVGSETMAMDLPYNWERVKKYPQLIGDFVWSGWDYLGEACFGDWTYESYPGYPLLAGQGMIDITGKPLASMAYMQIVWGLRKQPFICVRPLNHNHEVPNKGSWQFTNAIDSYSWDGYEKEKVYCEVYGSEDNVSLYLNGKKIGNKKYQDYKTYFTFPYESGELVAKSYDTNGNLISESKLVSASKKTILKATVEKETVRTGELSYIAIEFSDEEGNLKPYVEKEVTVETNGPIKLIGLGSALCKSAETYTDNKHTSYRGRLLAAVMAEKGKGIAEVTVSCPGYESIKAFIKVED